MNHVSHIPETLCQKFERAVGVEGKNSLVVVFGESFSGSEWIGSVDELQQHLEGFGVKTVLDSDGHLVRVEEAQVSRELIAA